MKLPVAQAWLSVLLDVLFELLGGATALLPGSRSIPCVACLALGPDMAMAARIC